MAKRPRILISRSRTVTGEYYIDAINSAGGDPIAEYAPSYDDSFDALLLAGGGDVAPDYYGEENNGSHTPDRVRDEAELALCKKFIDAGKPIMGICRGHQLLNVYFGGTLIQHLASSDVHSSDDYPVHESVAMEGGIVYNLFGQCPMVNSNHHQAIKVPGNRLRITQYSKKDGVIEAMQHEELPVFSVQWHPEQMCGRALRKDAPDTSCLFEYFISLCK